MSKIFTVFGATGNQGGSVIKAILADPVLSKQFKLRGITRDITKPAAQALAAQGVEVVKADMASQEAAAPAVEGADTVFLVTNFWESANAEIEISQGKAVTDAAKAAGVKHLIFSSLINVTEATNGRLPHVSHFDGKATIEKYIRQSGVPATFVLPGIFMSSNFGLIKEQSDGSYAMSLPVTENAKFPFFAPNEDMGLFVNAAVKHPEFIGKHILAATDYFTPGRILSEFSEVMGKPAVFNQIPAEVFKSFMPPNVAQELLENFLLFDEPGYYNGASLDASLSILDRKPTAWKDFVAQNKQKWL